MGASIQERFAGDRFGRDVPLTMLATPDWWAVCRDDTRPIDVLAARFPVVRRLVGEDSFAAMARRFAASEPPTLLTLPCYGETFPRFLRRQGCNAVSIEYVADIAELEMVRGRARHAADAVPLGGRAVSSLRAEWFGELHLELHPSLFLVASRFPIVTVWEHNRRDGKTGMIERWGAESALVARPFVTVEVRRLPPGGYAFISALSQGRTIAEAVDAGAAAAAKFDIAANVAFLIEADVVVGIRERAHAVARRRNR